MNEQKGSDRSFGFRELTLSLIILGFVIWVVMSNFIPNPHRQPQYNCINNLRQIDAAANQFALENHRTNGDRINFPADLTPYIKLDRNGKIPSCPGGGIYHLSKVGEAPTCSLGTSVTPAHVLP